MTTGEFDLLDGLAQFGPLSPGELAAYGRSTSHQNATQNLRRLARRGFVERGDTGIWHLTYKAREVLAL